MDKTTLHFTCLNKEECIWPIETDGRFIPSRPVLDEQANLYLLFRDRGDIFYLDTRQRSVRYIALNLNSLDGYYSLSAYGKIILTDIVNDNLVIINEDFSYKVVQVRTANENRYGPIGGLVRGERNKVIVFNSLPVSKDGQDFAEIFVVDLNGGDVEKRLVPSPQFERLTPNPLAWKPRVRYNVRFIGVTKDLNKLYYTFLWSEETGEDMRARLGMFDTKNGKEPYVYQRDGCVAMAEYRQYKDYLFVSKGDERAVILRLKDLSPVVNFDELQEERFQTTISPFGKYFLVGTVGTDSKVFVLSQNGVVLREYPLPANLIGKDYTFVEFLDD